jgi:hypothetical protein
VVSTAFPQRLVGTWMVCCSEWARQDTKGVLVPLVWAPETPCAPPSFPRTQATTLPHPSQADPHRGVLLCCIATA